MLPSRPRSGSWDGAPRTPPASKATPWHQRSNSTATYSSVPSSEERSCMDSLQCDSGGGGGDMTEQMVAQLEEELRAEEEDKTRALQELTELRGNGGAAKDEAGDERVRVLEREVSVAKETEMKMLESLIHQTKELEQAKIALEEAKLEAAALRRQGAAAEPAAQWSVMDLMFGGVDEEINGLRGKLRAAVVAEERSRKAADDLAAALSAVTMEAKQVKAWLSDAQAELESANAEIERLEGLLHTAEAELWSITEQLEGLASEWKDAAAAWRAREKVLLGRVRAAEDNAAGARQENAELAELHRVVHDENGALRRALEQAVEEAHAANESLELAAGENTELRDAIAYKEDALESLRQENERLKASEAAAQGRVKELDGQLAAARKANDDGGASEKATTELPLEKWRGEVQGKLSAAFLDSGRVMASRKDRMFASISNIAELKSAAAAAAMDDFDYEFDHFDGGLQYGDTDHAMKHKKRRSVLRKFGDFFRRRSLYKSNLAPVLHY